MISRGCFGWADGLLLCDHTDVLKIFEWFEAAANCRLSLLGVGLLEPVANCRLSLLGVGQLEPVLVST